MEPNIFRHYRHSREDSFSHSLAYVLNLFKPLANAFLRRIAKRAGKAPNYFGDFETCDFAAHDSFGDHKVSKPDLKLVCTRRTLYLENKLEAPLSMSQMQRHSILVCGTPKCDLAFISNISHRRSNLRTVPGYLHPEDADHYLWVDLLPALDAAYRKGSVTARLLSDFRAALKLEGMIGRTIKGASGNLYTKGSGACDHALRQLSGELQRVGFAVQRKPPQESTLRVRLSREIRYPLLNPRFQATASELRGDLDHDALVFTVISPASDARIARRLANFPSQRDCVFVPGYSQNFGYTYTYYGWFVVRTKFISHGAASSIDFEVLRKPFARILKFLKLSWGGAAA